MPKSDAIKAMLAIAFDKIEKYGWAVPAVGPGASTPGWCYTAGLTGKNFPELIIKDMPANPAQHYLNHAASQLTRGFWELPGPGDRTTVVMQDGTWWNLVHHGTPPHGQPYRLPVAYQLYGASAVTALELVPPADLRTPPGTPWPGFECAIPGCDHKH
jgi:hypothetical protein